MKSDASSLTKATAVLLAATLALAGCDVTNRTPTQCGGTVQYNQWMRHTPTGVVGQVWWGDFSVLYIRFPGDTNHSFQTRCEELEVLP